GVGGGRGAGGVREGVQQPVQGGAAGAGGDAVQVAFVQDVGAEPVTDTAGQEPDGADGGDDQVAFFHVGGADVHAGGQVGQGPGLQFPVGDQVAEEGAGGAGGDGPVHAAHVV